MAKKILLSKINGENKLPETLFGDCHNFSWVTINLLILFVALKRNIKPFFQFYLKCFMLGLATGLYDKLLTNCTSAKRNDPGPAQKFSHLLLLT